MYFKRSMKCFSQSIKILDSHPPVKQLPFGRSCAEIVAASWVNLAVFLCTKLYVSKEALGKLITILRQHSLK